MSKGHKLYVLLLAVLVLAVLGVRGYCYHNEHTPEYALRKVQQAVQEQDEAAFVKYVDVDAFLMQAYDDGAEQLANHVGELHERYPKDYFFWHDSDFMRQYAAEHRSAALPFLHNVLNHYFQDDMTAGSFEENAPAWLAAQMKKFSQSGCVEVQSVHENGERATASLVLHGTDSAYGHLLDQLTVTLELKRQPDGFWRVSRILNAEQLTLPVTDRAEAFWTLQGWQQ